MVSCREHFGTTPWRLQGSTSEQQEHFGYRKLPRVVPKFGLQPPFWYNSPEGSDSGHRKASGRRERQLNVTVAGSPCPWNSDAARSECTLLEGLHGESTERLAGRENEIEAAFDEYRRGCAASSRDRVSEPRPPDTSEATGCYSSSVTNVGSCVLATRP